MAIRAGNIAEKNTRISLGMGKRTMVNYKIIIKPVDKEWSTGLL